MYIKLPMNLVNGPAGSAGSTTSEYIRVNEKITARIAEIEANLPSL